MSQSDQSLNIFQRYCQESVKRIHTMRIFANDISDKRQYPEYRNL